MLFRRPCVVDDNLLVVHCNWLGQLTTQAHSVTAKAVTLTSPNPTVSLRAQFEYCEHPRFGEYVIAKVAKFSGFARFQTLIPNTQHEQEERNC